MHKTLKSVKKLYVHSIDIYRKQFIFDGGEKIIKAV